LLLFFIAAILINIEGCDACRLLRNACKHALVVKEAGRAASLKGLK
jgi:hypothetical protein